MTQSESESDPGRTREEYAPLAHNEPSELPPEMPPELQPGQQIERRRFLHGVSALGAGLIPTLLGQSGGSAAAAEPVGAATVRKNTPLVGKDTIPRRKLGKTGLEVSVLGIGGHHIGLPKDEAVALRIIAEAVDAGINFFDNAWEYNQGRSEERMGKALKDGGRRDKVVLMTKVCTHGRDAQEAMHQLETSLRRLQTDHLDLWQIHEVIYDNDPDRHFAKGGVIEALELAKRQGKVRFVGFTGHKDPAIHLKMLAHKYPFDTCQLPLNCLDATFRSFEHQVLPELRRQGIAALGMKSMGGEGQIARSGVVTPQEALRYAMSLDVATTISGIDSVEVLQQNLAVARGFIPLGDRAMQELRNRCAPLAADGRWELFKTSKNFDGDEGRKQHGFPPQKQVPL